MSRTVSPQRLSSEQKLALAVILQAVEDVLNPRINLRTKLEATGFLKGERSAVCCRVVGLDPRSLQRLASVL